MIKRQRQPQGAIADAIVHSAGGHGTRVEVRHSRVAQGACRCGETGLAGAGGIECGIAGSYLIVIGGTGRQASERHRVRGHQCGVALSQVERAGGGAVVHQGIRSFIRIPGDERAAVGRRRDVHIADDRRGGIRSPSGKAGRRLGFRRGGSGCIIRSIRGSHPVVIRSGGRQAADLQAMARRESSVRGALVESTRVGTVIEARVRRLIGGPGNRGRSSTARSRVDGRNDRRGGISRKRRFKNRIHPVVSIVSARWESSAILNIHRLDPLFQRPMHARAGYPPR